MAFFKTGRRQGEETAAGRRSGNDFRLACLRLVALGWLF